MKRLLFVFLLAAACGHRAVVPRDTQLWRIDAPWVTPPGTNVRTAPATILVFRTSGEFVELHCQLIEQPDQTVYIRSGSQYIAAVGKWKQNGETIAATREKIGENISVPFAGAQHPLCKHAQLTFHIEGNAVSGSAGEKTPGTYAPVTRLVAPDFESYVNEAKRSPVTCVQK